MPLFEPLSVKDSIRQKNIKRNKQLAQLLIKNPRFQNTIKKAREKLGIPVDGFSDQKSFDSYYKQKEKEFKNKKLDKKSKSGTDFFGKFGLHLKTEIHGCLSIDGLLFNMEKFFEHYLFFNEMPEDDSIYFRLPYCTDYPDEFSKRYIKLSIIIDDSTTIEEIKAVWPRVMVLQRERKFLIPVNQKKEIDPDTYLKMVESYKRKPQFKEIKNMGRDELIVKLKKNGLTCTAIRQKLKELGYGSVNYEYVSKIIERYNKRIGIRKA